MITAWLILALLFPSPQGTTGLLTANAAAGGGCNEFSETTWDNLTGWTQDSNNDFSVDATNDELDTASLLSGSERWITNDTDTTDADHCAMWQVKTLPPNVDELLIGLRMPTTNADFYGVGYEFQESAWEVTVYTRTSSGATWDSQITTNGAAAPDSGDYISACVEGTGSGTEWTVWDHGGTDPGPCRDDWGAPFWTATTDPSTEVNSGTRVGLLLVDYAPSDTTAGVMDEFDGGDF